MSRTRDKYARRLQNDGKTPHHHRAQIPFALIAYRSFDLLPKLRTLSHGSCFEAPHWNNSIPLHLFFSAQENNWLDTLEGKQATTRGILDPEFVNE